MHRSFFPFIFIAAGASLLFACGLGASRAGNPNECPPGADCPPVPDAGHDAQLTCDNNAPGPRCTGCNGEPVAGECVDGVWTCPEFGCPVEIDAGCAGQPPLACSTPVGSCHYYEPECIANQWTCTDVGGVCLDAGPPDAPIVIYDASPPPPPPPFACGNLGCDPEASYCQITTGGPVDAGNTTFACDLLPSACNGSATCGCIGIIGQGCACIEQHGDVTLTCELP